MARFKGFSTVNRYKKFTVTDRDLVIRDLLNILSIREGELPGKPDVGTRIWNFIFEANTPEVIRQITAEIQRITTYDPRVEVVDVVVSSLNNTVNLELVIIINPNVSPETINFMFDQDDNTVQVV